MSSGLYLGKQVDPGTGALGARLELDPSDLLTHGLIVGMTGSGKTGLAIVLLEELLRQGVPVIAIDPKGDLANLLLLFDHLDAAAFEPWTLPDAARRDGEDVKAAAAAAAAAWKKGLAEWGLGEGDIAALKKAHEAVIFTPGSTAGVPLNVLQSLDAPAAPFDSAAEDLRDEIQSIVSGLLGLVHVEADPLQSPPAVFLANLVEKAWRAGKGYSLEELIGAIADPPFDKIGALPLEAAFPRKERQALLMALNNLLASPSFESWRTGEPLDVARMLRAADGRPRLSIVSTAHLSDEERLFVTALLLDKVKTWMRRQAGTTELRALVYMDEIFGYFPPHPANPPTKRPLLTLLKQARAQGVGVVLATQNPVDLDYKGLANMGTWMVGTLQTRQDRERLLGGLQGAGLEPSAVTKLLAATKKRVFLLHDVHRKEPTLLQSRWAMSYLRGPLTREEISSLMKQRPAAPAAAAPPRPAVTSPPVLPAPFRNLYLKRRGGEVATPHLLVKYAVRYKGVDEIVAVRAWPLSGATPADTLEAEPFEADDVRAAIAHYVACIPYGQVLSTAQHISTDINFRDVDEEDMAEALIRRDEASTADRDVFASFIGEAFLTELEKHGDEIVYQFSFGAEPLPFETGSKLRQETIFEVAAMIARHPRLRFQVFLSSEHGDQAMCTLARELPNLSLAGYWWHNFFPGAMRKVMSERLDMLAANKQIGFFSDAYCVDWTYAKAVIVRKQLAEVLAQKVNQGQYTVDEALSIARQILFDSPQSLLNFQP